MEDRRFTDALLATVVGTYGLAALGATTAETVEAEGLALVHHGLAVVLGAALAAVCWTAWTQRRRAGVRHPITIAAAAYPVQAAVGLTIRSGAPLEWLHLALGMGIFAALLVAMIQQLDDRHAATGQANPPGAGSRDRGPDPRREPSVVDTDEPAAGSTGLTGTFRAYLALTKPRLMWLLCLLALSGMGLASITGATLNGGTVVATLGSGILAVGASGTFNHLYERDRDQRMARTADRPLATDRVSPAGAATFGLALAAVSLAVMVAVVNVLAAALTAAAIAYYSLLYTVVLKPNTTWSIAIGGGAGALPAVIGWAAVTGTVGVPALLLAAVVICWTPGHFYNLGIAYREDYERGDYPIVPVVHGVGAARRRIGYAFGATFVVAAALGVVAELGAVYTTAVVLGAGGLLLTVVRQYRLDTHAATMRSFHASNAFLGGVLLALLVETLFL